jgi:hypothetical protein
MKHKYLIGIAAMMLWSCGENSKTGEALKQTGEAIKEDAQEITKSAKQKADEMIANFPKEKEAFLNKAKQKRDSLDSSIKKLQRDYKSGKLSKDAKAELTKLKEERKTLAVQIEKTSHVSAEAWAELKTGFQKAGIEVSTGVKKAQEKIKQ